MKFFLGWRVKTPCGKGTVIDIIPMFTPLINAGAKLVYSYQVKLDKYPHNTTIFMGEQLAKLRKKPMMYNVGDRLRGNLTGTIYTIKKDYDNECFQLAGGGTVLMHSYATLQECYKKLKPKKPHLTFKFLFPPYLEEKRALEKRIKELKTENITLKIGDNKYGYHMLNIEHQAALERLHKSNDENQLLRKEIKNLENYLREEQVRNKRLTDENTHSLIINGKEIMRLEEKIRNLQEFLAKENMRVRELQGHIAFLQTRLRSI